MYKNRSLFLDKVHLLRSNSGAYERWALRGGPILVWRAWLSRLRPTQENLRKLPLWCMAEKASFWWAWDEKGPEVWWGGRMSGLERMMMPLLPCRKRNGRKGEERHEVSLTQRRKAERRKNPGGESSNIICIVLRTVRSRLLRL